MKQKNNEKGITLIALVITIIVLLILAAISIATLTGENGILAKASKAEKDADIAETKEQIKLEIMGNIDDKKTNYDNQNVIDAIKKVTGKEVDVNEEIVESQKGNDVNIADLWVAEKTTIQFTFVEPFGEEFILNANEGDRWIDWLYDVKNGIREDGGVLPPAFLNGFIENYEKYLDVNPQINYYGSGLASAAQVYEELEDGRHYVCYEEKIYEDHIYYLYAS